MASKQGKNPLQPIKKSAAGGQKPKKAAQNKLTSHGEEPENTTGSMQDGLPEKAAKNTITKKTDTLEEKTDSTPIEPIPTATTPSPAKKTVRKEALKKAAAAKNVKAAQQSPPEETIAIPSQATTVAVDPEQEPIAATAKPAKKAKAAKPKKEAGNKEITPDEPQTQPAATVAPGTTGTPDNAQTQTGQLPAEIMPGPAEAIPEEPDAQPAAQTTTEVTAAEPHDLQTATPETDSGTPPIPAADEIITEVFEQEENTEEKNRSVAHKLVATATHAHKKQPVNTIYFYLRFYSKPGQNLFITAQHPLFGNGNPEAALPMEFLNAETWTAVLPVGKDFTKEPLVYNYLLKEPDGSFVYDAGADKVIESANYTTGEVSIVDSWNVAGFFENAFYTEPFKEVLLKHNYTATEYAEPAVFTHTFKVKAPLLAQGQVPYIMGNTAALGNWNVEKHLLLHKKEQDDYWSIDLDLTEATFAFDYKYGVYDIRENKIVHIETGENRNLYDTIAANKKTIVNDGFIRLPNNTWKGAGVAIPVFSLKSENSLGTGEFTDIKKLVDWAGQVGLKLIQLLPVNDTTATKTWHDSYPYSAISAFALHAMYLNLGEVVAEEHKHFLEQHVEESKSLNALPSLDYEKVNDIKWKVIHHIYPLQRDAVFGSEDYRQFFEKNQHWLIPYAAFCYLRDKNNTADYARWQEYKTYDEKAVKGLVQSPETKDIAGMYYFVQYHLHLQLKEATDYAHARGIIVKGDIAIGVSRNSVETWQQPELFNLNMQAGAPPDDFAVKGQNWGFPTYNWQKMQEDGFEWWKRRFEQMSYYFDAFRIDHILGFFRIWSIPSDAIQGILGRFVPALPVHISEFHQQGIYFDYNRYVKPYINDGVLHDLFGDQQWWIKDNLLTANGDGTYALKDELNTQMRVQTYFAIREDNAHNQWLKNTLFDLVANVILFEEKGSNGQQFHFRFGMEETPSYRQLDPHTQWQLRQLSINYFYDRQNDFWYQQAKKILPALKQATNMLICGEDLGMVPESVPRLMGEMGLLSLEVQRMPKDHRLKFVHLAGAPYLSVVTPSTHDMSTIRGWWEEDRATTQAFYNRELGQQGEAPQHCVGWINRMIVSQHLQSPAMWSIFQLQDLLGSDEHIRRPNPQDEQINKPATAKFYWQYRMHLTLEDLMQNEEFNNHLKEAISSSGR